MKTLKFKTPLFALVLGLLIAFTGSAFTAKKSMQTWHLKSGQTINDVKDAAAYEVSSGTESCNNLTGLPCKIQFDENESADLQTYLDQFGTEQEVVDNAISIRSN